MSIELYWPNAVTKDGEKLSTIDALLTKEKALNQFNIWESHYGYQIKQAWITDADGKKIDVRKQWAEVSEDA